MIEHIIIGCIQGVTEWLPVSSSGVITLVKKNILHSSQSIEALSKENLFLHLGTFLAALIYLRREILLLCKSLFSFSKAEEEQKKVLVFLFLSTLISGTLGLGLIKLLSSFEDQFDVTGKLITCLIGIFLLFTAAMELSVKKSGHKSQDDLQVHDGIALGIAQGFAALPGISRSGITVAILLLKKFDKTTALKLSFLMSLPIVFAGNILMHFSETNISLEGLTGLASAFIFGILSMHALIRFAQKVNFGYFMLFFGALTIISAFI